jgi:hypothetical protein
MKSFMLLASLVLGQSPFAAPACPPTGNEPGLAYVTLTAAGDEVVMKRFVTEFVCEMQTRNITVNDKDGKPKTQTIAVTVCKPVYKQFLVTANTSKMKGFDGAGEKLDAAELKRRIGKSGSALIAFHEQHVDANWFTVLKPDALVLVLASDAIAPPLPPGVSPAVPKMASALAEQELGFVMMQDAKIAAPRMFPNIGGASIDADGIVHLQTSRQMWTTKTMSYTVNVDDKAVTKTAAIQETFVHSHRRDLPIDLVGAFTVGGKKVEKADLKAAIAKPRVVLVTNDGQGLDPAHAELLKEDTLVLVPPASTPSFGPANPPAPGSVAPMPSPAVPGSVVPQPQPQPQPPKRADL